jgi:hypothetical protein
MWRVQVLFARRETGVHKFDSQMNFSLFGNRFVYYYFSNVGLGEAASQSESPFIDRGTCEKIN